MATLMAKQNADQERVQELYKEYEEAKKRFIVSSREHRNYLARKDTSRTILQREKAMLDAEMENVIDEKRKLEEKIVAESYIFKFLNDILFLIVLFQLPVSKKLGCPFESLSRTPIRICK